MNLKEFKAEYIMVTRDHEYGFDPFLSQVLNNFMPKLLSVAEAAKELLNSYPGEDYQLSENDLKKALEELERE